VIPESERPVQRWIDEAVFADAVKARGDASGELMYFTKIRIDHRESEETQVCRVQLAESRYPEVLAIEDLRVHQPHIFDRCDKIIAANAREYLRSPMPSSIAVNLVPVTEDLDVLCAERSSAVDSAIGWWTVGVFETMKRADPNRPGSTEDLYSLAVRGIEEELGLRPQEYGEVMISWVGLYRPILRGHVVAIVQPRVPRDEVIARAREAHSGYEHTVMDWLPLRRSVVRSFVRAPETIYSDKVGKTIRVGNRTYIEQSRLAILEAWRFRVLVTEWSSGN
jgi:hypothetical protein